MIKEIHSIDNKLKKNSRKAQSISPKECRDIKDYESGRANSQKCLGESGQVG